MLPASALVPELVVTMSDVHQQARTRAAHCTVSLLARHKEDGGLDEYKESIQGVLVTALNDVSADSRLKGKAAFTLVKDMWPEAATHILALVSDKVKGQLDGSGADQGGKEIAKKAGVPANPSKRIDFKALRDAQRKKVGLSSPALFFALALIFAWGGVASLVWGGLGFLAGGG